VASAELASCVAGFAAVAVELASRFCRDALEDRYFGWDPERFASRAEHNLVRAAGQLELATRVLAARSRLEAAVQALASD
jgi:hypothetical protein